MLVFFDLVCYELCNLLRLDSYRWCVVYELFVSGSIAVVAPLLRLHPLEDLMNLLTSNSLDDLSLRASDRVRLVFIFDSILF